MNDQIAKDLRLLSRARDHAMNRGINRVTWGFVIRSKYDETGELRYQLTTVGGESMYLTHALLDDLGSVILQGEAFACVSATDAGEPHDPVEGIRVVLWLGEPMEDSTDQLCVTSEYQLGRDQPLIALCEHKPRSWPV